MQQGKPWLVYARKHAEHTQRSLAKSIGVSRSLIDACERVGYIPSIATQELIASEIGIPLDWFHNKPSR